MKRTRRSLAIFLVSTASLSLSTTATSTLALAEEPVDQNPAADPAARIAWYGTWESGLREAKRSQRPILLVSAAPHCHRVSGLW
jgi:hypothetical protein